MKILLVNTYDKGGAANACLRLHDGLLLKGVDSKVLLLRKEQSIQQTFQLKQPKPSRLKQKIKTALRLLNFVKTSKISKEQQFLKNRAKGLELFSFPNSNYDITTSPLYQEADIINLHWVARFLDYESFFKKNTKPVVWTLHDMNPFTGGEHYLENYLGMDDLRVGIPRVYSEEEEVVSIKNILLKKKALSNIKNLHIVTLCSWMSNEVVKSDLFKHLPITLIPNGIDSEIFQPRDKMFSREVLNIPKDKKVILFVADSISNHRKGYTFLKKALQMIHREDVVMCAVGRKKTLLDATNQIIELGAINDEKLMSMVYSAADVFVIPSLIDNLPNTILESLMCGTPVIGFPVGGIPDMIRDGENGFLTEQISSHALIETIDFFFNSMDSFDGKLIRENAIAKYELEINAKSYIKLFQNIIKE